MRPIRLASAGCSSSTIGRRLVAVLRDQDVDLVAVEQASRSEFDGLALVIFALDDEHGDIFDQIGANRFDVLEHPRNVVEGGFRILDQLIDGVFRRVAIELAYFVAPLFLPLRQLMNDVLEVLLQSFDGGLHFAALGLRPSSEFVRRDDLAVFGGRQRKAERRAQQDDIFFGGLVAQRGKGLALLFLE